MEICAQHLISDEIHIVTKYLHLEKYRIDVNVKEIWKFCLG